MKQVNFKQVDVFTVQPYKGNPVAVIMDAQGLSDAHMQQIANWTNLSETTFVLPTTDPSASYRLRIFTPGAELPFAGHPTIGTAHALLEAGLVQPVNGTLVQECGAGLIRLSVGEGDAGRPQIAFELPVRQITSLDNHQLDTLESALGVQVQRAFRPALVDVGARWIVAQLADGQQVLANQADMTRLKSHTLAAGATGVLIFGPYPQGSPTGVEVRAYAPACGVNEDPVCGSGNGAMAAFIRHTGQTEAFGPSLLASQGARLGRAGVIQLSIDSEVIRVGGQAVTCIDGMIAV